MDKLIITAAISGSGVTRDMTPNVPITPDEITKSAIECWRAGAAIAHIHVRDPETGLGSLDLDLFKQVVEKVREQSDLIICLTTSDIPGRNPSVADRLSTIALLPELVELPMGSINLAGKTFINSPEFIKEALIRMKNNGVKPELAVLDTGMIMSAFRMQEEGLIEDDMHFQILLGTPWGAPATPKSLLYLYEQIPDKASWSVAVRGEASLSMHIMALIMGGHVRPVWRIIFICKKTFLQRITPSWSNALYGLQKSLEEKRRLQMRQEKFLSYVNSLWPVLFFNQQYILTSNNGHAMR